MWNKFTCKLFNNNWSVKEQMNRELDWIRSICRENVPFRVERYSRFGFRYNRGFYCQSFNVLDQPSPCLAQNAQCTVSQLDRSSFSIVRSRLEQYRYIRANRTAERKRFVELRVSTNHTWSTEVRILLRFSQLGEW